MTAQQPTIWACDIGFTDNELAAGLLIAEELFGLEGIEKALAADGELTTYHLCLLSNERYQEHSAKELSELIAGRRFGHA